MRVTFHGQSCLTVEPVGTSFLFDPFVRPDELARHVDFPAVRADGLLAAYGHCDRVADAVDLASRPGAPVIADGRVGSSHDF